MPQVVRVRLSIIIPAFNEEKLLGRTLRCVNDAKSVFLDCEWQVEVIVCDNNSTDRTAEVARQEGAQVVFEPVNQIGRARNRGAECATGTWLLFIDADCQPSRPLFDDVARQIRSGKCLGGGSTVVLDSSTRAGASITAVWNRLSRWFGLLAGSFIFCEAAAFRQAGGFSAELFAGEELDLTQRLKSLARAQHKRLVILDEHPLITSARKVHLYTRWEHARFLIRAARDRRRVLRSREECHTWYDGRR